MNRPRYMVSHKRFPLAPHPVRNGRRGDFFEFCMDMALPVAIIALYAFMARLDEFLL